MNNNIDNKLSEAQNLIRAGELKSALDLLLRIISVDPLHSAAISAVAGIFLTVARRAEHRNNWVAAYKNYGRAIAFDPDNAETSARMLELMPEYLLSLSPAMGAPHARPAGSGSLLMGIGTGRCGSSSLTSLLMRQDDTYVSHEHGPMLPWTPDWDRFQCHVNRFRTLLSLRTCVGDISHWWLPYLERLLNEFPTMRVVCLKRDQQATVQSFEKIKGTGSQSVNHWIEHNGERWKRNLWDPCYPKYDVGSRSLALSLYWDEYYAIAAEYSRRFPKYIRMFTIEELGSEQGQKRILKFCGYDNPVTAPDLALNQGDIRDGGELY